MFSSARMRRRGWVLPTVVAACVCASEPARAGAGAFVGDDGLRREFAETYREGRRPGRREPHYVRAGAEMFMLIGIGSVLYYATDDRWAGSDYSGVADRFRHLRVSFDTSTFNTNALGHPGAGSMYHLFSRTNGLSIPAAFAYSAVSSFAWEFLFEVPENPSLNDLVVTPVAGVPIGELLVHVGDYFNSTPGKPRWYHEVLGWVFGPSHRIHRKLDGVERPVTTMPADSLGFSSFYSHRFDLLGGVVHVANNLDDSAIGGQVRLNAEIVSIPGFLRPGRFGVNFNDGEFVEALAQVNFGNGATGTEMLCDANLFGRYAQNIAEADRSGVATMFAFNSAARYANRYLLGRRDNYFVVHAGGPALKLWGVSGDFVARFDATVHLDFGAIRSLALPEHERSFGTDDVATVARMHSYYFGLGWSTAARGTLAYKGVELGGRVFAGHYESIDRADRFPDEVPKALHMSDSIAEFEGWFGLVSRHFPLQARVFFEHLPRSSTMLANTTTRWDQRYGLSVGGYL